MCGIAGIVGENLSEQVLDKMLFLQKHRGPDYTGKEILNNAVLGHNRLSIIDLSPEANQPFLSQNKRYSIVFNGEIYNYLELKKSLKFNYDFKTNSDTEVLLASYITYGKNCLEKLNGMFSFAIWDSEKNELFAARDRFGVKPFYYKTENNTFYFASEIKALQVNSDKNLNEKVWANYFAYGSYGLPSETFFKDIYQLAGGHYLELHNNKVNISKWYHFIKNLQQYNHSFDEAKENYTNLLKQSINLRFRADVNLGFNLSGGIDSSALLYFVNETQQNKKINAFTFYTDDDNYDELLWVNEMISQTNNPLEKVLLKPEQVPKLLKKIAFNQDEPFGGIPTLAYAKIFQKARENNILVLLDGQGMDEQLAGYDYYSNKNNSVIQGVSSTPFKPNILGDNFHSISQKPKYPKPFKEDLLNLQYRDLFFTKIPRALRFNDRVSMAFSTELREPFLDYRLVEYAFNLPKEYKIKNNQQKFLLREIMKNRISKKNSYSPKRALQTPQREWLGKELINLVENSLEKIYESKYKHWFNKDELKIEWRKYKKGKNDSSFHIWQWINFSQIINQ